MTTFDDLLAVLEKRGLKLVWSHGKPGITGLVELQTPTLIEALKAFRDDVIEYLGPAPVEEPVAEPEKTTEPQQFTDKLESVDEHGYRWFVIPADGFVYLDNLREAIRPGTFVRQDYLAECTRTKAKKP